MGLPFLIAALVLNMNQTTWFSGEDGVETALWWIGGILMAVTVLWFFVVIGIGLLGAGSASRRSSRW